MNKIQKIDIKLLVIIAFIVTAALSTTYALLNLQVEQTTALTQVGCFDVDYTGTVLTTSSLVSTTDYTEGAHATVTLKKDETCSIYSQATIHLHTDETNTAPLNEVKALKYKVMLGNNEIDSGVVKDNSTSDSAPTDFTIDLATVELTTTATTYDIYLWIDSNVSMGTYDGKIFSGYIYASSEQTSTINDGESDDGTQGGGTTISTPFIRDVMAVNATSDANIDFSVVSSSSGTNGIYYIDETINDTNPIYYYRGAVDNNLLFAGFCWKIVRTTETGGLKLIYNGTPSSGTCNNTGTSSQIGKKAFNSSSNSPAYVGYMYGTPYTYSSKSMSSDTTAYVYGNTVTYTGGTYTLSGTTSSSSWSNIYSSGLNSNHYTCFTTGTTCTSVYYIYSTTSSYAYYITLTGGKTVEDALEDMLDNNTTSSTIKGNSTTTGTLDYWYYNNIEQAGYSDYIEDTVWCNDRSISNLNGWNPDGGSTSSYLYFSGYNRAHSTYEPSLTCSRDIDKFTVSESNGNGDLDYPVGLLTSDEIMLAGGNRNTSNKTYYLYTGNDYWAGSPFYFNPYGAYGFNVYSNGLLTYNNVSYAAVGVRPSISLAAGFTISGGDGTTSSPYVVDATAKPDGDEVTTRTITFYNGSSSIGTQEVPDSTATALTSWSNLGGSVLSGYSGWSFAGWSTSSSANKVDYTDKRKISVTANTNLYAVYSRNLNVNYNANGGSGTVNSTSKNIYLNSNSTTTSSQSINLASNAFTKTGYTFSKWTAGSTSGTAYSAGASYNPSLAYNASSFNVTMYAKWNAITYTIKYNGNGSTGGSVTASSHTYDTAKALTDNAFTKTGHTFAGWSTASDITVEYEDGESVTNLSSTSGATVNLYAQWNANTYTVTYNCNGGTGTTASSSHAYGVAKNLTANACTRTGYTFSGWALSANGAKAYNDGQSVTNLSSTNGATVTLYAQWRINKVYIKYSTNGGNITSTTIEDGVTYTWIKDTNDIIYQETSSQPATSTFQVYDYGGSTSTNGLADWNNTKYINISKTGYVAKSGEQWICLSGDCTKNKTYDHNKVYAASDFCDASNGDCTAVLGVNWTITSYRVVAHPNGGTIPATTGWTAVTSRPTYYKNVTYGSTYGTLPTPTKSGYLFDGWYNVYNYGTLTKPAITNTQYSHSSVYEHVYPGVTFNITMDSATKTAGNATQFTTVIYDFTNSTELAKVQTSFGSNISYSITCPSTADSSHDIKVIIYAGVQGATSGVGTTYSNIKIYTADSTTQTKYTSTSTVNTARTHILFAKWKPLASASARTGLKFTGASQTGVTGSNVTWSGTTAATNPGTYSAKATANSGYVFSNGSSTTTVSWSIAGHTFAVGNSFTMSAGGSGYFSSSSRACSNGTKSNTLYSSSGYYATISSFYTSAGVANTSSHSYSEANSYAIYVPKVLNSSGSSVYGSGYFRLDQVIKK